MAILEARALTKIIDTGTHRVEILRGVDFEVPAGQFVAIMGASGSGKSTLLGLLAGLDTPTSGSIVVDGTDITGLSEDKLAVVRGRKIGFVFQSYQLIPTLTAEENVLLPHELSGGNVAAGTARARELLDSVGLSDRLDHYPVQLSGGEQQRVALARAFMVKPPILMADEPTGNLDSVNGAHVLESADRAESPRGNHAGAGDARSVADRTRGPHRHAAGRENYRGRDSRAGGSGASMNLSLRTAARIAWRETRSSMVKFLFVVLAVAAGVGALSGVRGFSESFHGMLTTEARTVMAGDLLARQFVMPSAQQTGGPGCAGGSRSGVHLGHGNGFDGGVEIERRARRCWRR